MNILIVAATSQEISTLNEALKASWIESSPGQFTYGEITVSTLITGVGMVRTAFRLGNQLKSLKPDLCIQVGIAGAYNLDFEIGHVVHVTSEQIDHFGAQQVDDSIIGIQEMGLKEDIPLSNPIVNAAAEQFDFLPRACGLTVNLVAGHPDLIEKRRKIYHADVETMEGAAFFYACAVHAIPFIEIRGISNLVELRNRENWNIPLAIERSNQAVLEMLSTLGSN